MSEARDTVSIKFDPTLLKYLRSVARRRDQGLSLTVEQFIRAGIEEDEASRRELNRLQGEMRP